MAATTTEVTWREVTPVRWAGYKDEYVAEVTRGHLYPASPAHIAANRWVWRLYDVSLGERGFLDGGLADSLAAAKAEAEAAIRFAEADSEVEAYIDDPGDPYEVDPWEDPPSPPWF